MPSARARLLAAASCVLLVAGCTSVLPGSDPTSGDTYSDAEVREVLVHESSGPIESQTLAEWYEEAAEVAPEDAFDPSSCRNSVSPVLLYDRDASAEGTLYRPATVEREYDGATVTATQFVRLFESEDDAADFLSTLRAERSACPEFSVEGTTVAQGVVDGDFAVEAVGFSFDVTSPDGSTYGAFEWVLHDRNLLIALDGSGDDLDALKPLIDQIAAEYASRLE
jgi:hypothetical protein